MNNKRKRNRQIEEKKTKKKKIKTVKLNFFSDCESEEEEEEEKVEQTSLKNFQEEAENDQFANCSLASEIENATTYEQSLEMAEAFVEKCSEFIESFKSETESQRLDQTVKRRKKRIKLKDANRLKQFSKKKINVPFNYWEKNHNDTSLYIYAEESPVMNFYRRGNNTQFIVKHPLECPRLQVGDKVGVYSVLEGIQAEGEVVDAIPCIGKYKVNILRSWSKFTGNSMPYGTRIFDAHELVKAKKN